MFHSDNVLGAGDTEEVSKQFCVTRLVLASTAVAFRNQYERPEICALTLRLFFLAKKTWFEPFENKFRVLKLKALVTGGLNFQFEM